VWVFFVEEAPMDTDARLDALRIRHEALLKTIKQTISRSAAENDALDARLEQLVRRSTAGE
jgi:hypothetical protein